jgi:hypothetical protein
MLANGAMKGFKAPKGSKRYYAAKFIACLIGFDIKILQEFVLSDIDLH